MRALGFVIFLVALPTASAASPHEIQKLEEGTDFVLENVPWMVDEVFADADIFLDVLDAADAVAGPILSTSEEQVQKLEPTRLAIGDYAFDVEHCVPPVSDIGNAVLDQSIEDLPTPNAVADCAAVEAMSLPSVDHSGPQALVTEGPFEIEQGVAAGAAGGSEGASVAVDHASEAIARQADRWDDLLAILPEGPTATPLTNPTRAGDYLFAVDEAAERSARAVVDEVVFGLSETTIFGAADVVIDSLDAGAPIDAAAREATLMAVACILAEFPTDADLVAEAACAATAATAPDAPGLSAGALDGRADDASEYAGATAAAAMHVPPVLLSAASSAADEILAGTLSFAGGT
ncbi:MAG TPA: hypothetical protein VM370_02255 [Candidatus Thermoplasmatota archaeon]|nr:hypothetical protein [Candidatus Thermoplasmatota archaeon]